MAHSIFHAKSSVRKFGGDVEEYIPIHNWFDATKAVRADFRHRALRHHKQGVALADAIFGDIWLEDGKVVTIDLIGEQHNLEDFQYNPDASDWYNLIETESWMSKNVHPDVIKKLLVRKFGGKVNDYSFLIDFFNQFNTDDPRSKYILNHSWGIFDAESIYGVLFVRDSDKKELPTRTVAETIICTNFGFIPTPAQWTESITETSWMYSKAIPLSQDVNL